jgi:TRAP-type mannitol/chloroaromatic compound transport system permease small subunit
VLLLCLIGSRRAGLLAAGALARIVLMSAVLLVCIARVSLLLAVISSAAGMAACWYLFGELLGVRLPAGPF